MGFVFLFLALLGGLMAAREPGAPDATLAPRDRDAVLAVTREYRDAWLANDSARVMGTLSSNAVLVPSGMAPIVGEQAIRAFWFPADGPPTTVTAMEQHVTDVIGSGDRAVATGRGLLTFHVGHDGRSRTQHSWFANVLTRQPDGRWLITRRMWVDLVAQPVSLEARFIGNMAFALTDGSTTVMTDFPYQSGYSVYMEYDAAEIRSATPATLSLITHRHGDHWDRSLFEKTPWQVAGPSDVISSLPAARVVSLEPRGSFGPVQIEALETPHANIGHYSYVVTWHGRRLYFSGDTETPTHLAAVKSVDVAFLSPWLYRAALKSGIRLDTKRIVIYHHQAGEAVPECKVDCVVPNQGETIRIP